jgi:hypothetical protein
VNQVATISLEQTSRPVQRSGEITEETIENWRTCYREFRDGSNANCFIVCLNAIPRDYPAPGIAHNKVMIFDGRYVFTGSFNFSKRTKMRNAEKILLIDEPSLAPDLNRKHQQKSDAGKKSEG